MLTENSEGSVLLFYPALLTENKELYCTLESWCCIMQRSVIIRIENKMIMRFLLCAMLFVSAQQSSAMTAVEIKQNWDNHVNQNVSAQWAKEKKISNNVDAEPSFEAIREIIADRLQKHGTKDYNNNNVKSITPANQNWLVMDWFINKQINNDSEVTNLNQEVSNTYNDVKQTYNKLTIPEDCKQQVISDVCIYVGALKLVDLIKKIKATKETATAKAAVDDNTELPKVYKQALPVPHNPTDNIETNLDKYPTKFPYENLPKGSTITLGDMHGNTLKLIHFLIMSGIIELKPTKWGGFTIDQQGSAQNTYNRIKYIYNSYDVTEESKKAAMSMLAGHNVTLQSYESNCKDAEENYQKTSNEFGEALDNYSRKDRELITIRAENKNLTNGADSDKDVKLAANELKIILAANELKIKKIEIELQQLLSQKDEKERIDELAINEYTDALGSVESIKETIARVEANIKTDEELLKYRNESALSDFRLLLKNNLIQFNSNFNLRLLGDILADRGNNDVLTILLFEKMDEAGVKYEICASNHDIWFLQNLNKDNGIRGELDRSEGQSRSINILIDDATGELWKEAKELIGKHYLPHFKLLSYELNSNNDEITVFTHAKNDGNIIEKLAEEEIINVTYHGENVKQLAETIENINKSFISKLIVKDKQDGWKLMSNEEITPVCETVVNATNKKGAIGDLTWNREGKKNNSKLLFVHAHNGEALKENWFSQEGYTNLDTDAGKDDAETQGHYRAFVTIHDQK